MIITSSYFNSEIAIANSQDNAPNSNLLGNGKLLQNFINRYEPVILTKLFSYDLYKSFKEQFDININTGKWTLKTTADVKWSELLNGVEYQVNGIYHKWNGLIYKDGYGNNANDKSLIAFYIFPLFIEYTEFTHSGVGMQSESAKNAERVAARTKIVSADNIFYEMAIVGNDTKSLYEFINDKNQETPETYPNFSPTETFTLSNRFGL